MVDGVASDEDALGVSRADQECMDMDVSDLAAVSRFFKAAARVYLTFFEYDRAGAARVALVLVCFLEAF